MKGLSFGFDVGRSNAVDHLTTPVAHWDFSQASAPYTDRSGAFPLSVGEDAAPPVQNADGFAPGIASLAFDGTDRHLVLPASEIGALQMGGRTDEVSVAAWVKRSGDTNSAIAGVWNEDIVDPARQYALFLNLGKYGGDDRVCGHVSAVDGTTPTYPYSRDYAWNARRLEPDGTDGWRFVAFTYDGAEIRSYLDGALELTPKYTDEEGQTRAANPYVYTQGLNPSGTEFTVGAVRMTGGFGNFLHGEIAGLRVWDRAITQEELLRLFLQERHAGAPIFKDTFRTVEKAPSRALGWCSLMGTGALDTTDLSPDAQAPHLFNFAASGAGNGGYLARTATSTGPALGYFSGFETAPMPFEQIGAVTWSMNNSSPDEFVRLALRLGTRWVVSDQTFSCAASHSASDWEAAEHFFFEVTRAASAWRTLEVVAGDTLALGGAVSANLSNAPLRAFGFFCDHGFSGTLRIGELSLMSA